MVMCSALEAPAVRVRPPAADPPEADSSRYVHGGGNYPHGLSPGPRGPGGAAGDVPPPPPPHRAFKQTRERDPHQQPGLGRNRPKHQRA